jgi:NADPH:quinone reductase-like Zn-dependent oxidoreductase
MMHYEETRQDLIRLMSDIAAGRVRLVIERVYPFEQALDALRKTETRHARGKLVVSVEHKE